MRTFRFLACACASTWVLCPPAHAAAPMAGPIEGRPEVVVRTVEQSAVAGRLNSFSITNGLALDLPGDRTIHIVAEDIVEIATHADIGTPSTGMFRVTLRSGGSHDDVIIGTAGRFDDDRVRIDSPGVGAIDVPLEWVDTWRNLELAAGRRDAIDRLTANSAADDRVLLTNGDVLSGVATRLDWSGFLLATSGGDVELPHDRVVGAAIVGLAPPRIDGLQARVRFVDGSVLTTDSMVWDSHRGMMNALGASHVVAGDHIARVEVAGGRWVWMSELEPTAFDHTPMLAIEWAPRFDRNALGGPIRVGGETFDRGIGVHSKSSLTYALNGQFKHFVTAYGIDDDSGKLADVTVRIKVDGAERYSAENVRRGELHGPVRIDVSGDRELELVVDFGKFGGIQDRFNWIEPALVR